MSTNFLQGLKPLKFISLLHKFWPHSKSHFHTLFEDFDLQHSPLGQIYAMCMPRQKLPPKTQWEKRVGEKSTSHALLMLHLLPR